MGIDGQNPGRRQIQRFTIAGALDGNKADQESSPGAFTVLENCLVDKRVGAVLKRPGSSNESLGSGLGIPLGMGEHITTSSGVMPINRTLIVNFAGSAFKINRANTWSDATITSRCAFATSKQTQFAQISTYLYIAGGLPAKYNNITSTIDRMGILPPSAGPVFLSISGGGAITLTSGTQYMYTYYDSSTGLESDWSDLSTSTGVMTNSQINISIPAATAQNWDKIRIYRTLDGGAFPYLVDTVASGTTSYTDNKTDAQLTARAFDRYENAVPPQSVFIMSAFSQCLWMVDADNPYKIRFSKPYTGSDIDLEYFPVDNYVISNEPVTGLFVVPGKMLVFHPRSVSYISGSSVDDFVFQPFIPGVGTVCPNSISTNGSDIVFLAEQGFVSIPGQGGSPTHLSREIDHQLQPILNGSYNSTFYASSAWNPAIRQFVFLIAAQSTANAPWEEVGTGYTSDPFATWQTTPGLVDDVWEDVANVNASAVMRVKFWGWSPELSGNGRNLWMEYTFPYLGDNNILLAFPVFLFHPRPSSDTCDPQQDKTYLGHFWSGYGGEIKACFRRDKNVDTTASGDVNISALLITGRIIPGEQLGGNKLFLGLGFNNSYSDPTSDGSSTTLNYLLDFDDPHIRTYAPSLKSFVFPSNSGDIWKTTDMAGKHMHLYIADTSSQSQSKILLGEFFIHFRERFKISNR